jgi:diguanylate cyclase (GGDEF)-like protein/PAS domain S-box-containing protein
MTSALVMVVEDNAITRKTMRRTLEAEGLRVVEAPDGNTALAQAAAARPTLVQDMNLPDLHGFELLERLRAIPRLAAIPILAVTGAPPERGEGSGTAQFTDVLIKPVDPLRLVRVINALVQAQSADPVATERRLRAVVAEDDLVQRKLLRIHLGHWGFEVAEAANGSAALRIALAAPPDVVVSDLLMPEMDGLALCQAMRRTPALAAVPVVLVSSYHLDEIDCALAAKSGANAVVPRSAEMVELGDALRGLMRRGVSTAAQRWERDRSTRDDLSRLVDQVKREAGIRRALEDSHVAVSTLLPFFERFSELGSQSDAERIDVSKTAEELLAGYLDASGDALGCAFLVSPTAGLTLESQLGYRDPAATGLATFFGRRDLLERALRSGVAFQVPSSELAGDDIDAFLRRAGVTSMLLVPLVLRGKPFGVLALGSQRAARPPDALRVAEAVRGPIAQALALSRSVAELVISRQAFRGIVDSTSDSIVVTEASGQINYANPAALETFGCAAGELIGRPIGEILPFLEGSTDAGSGAGLRKDGRTFPAAATITAFEDSPGHMLRAYLIRDLSLRETLDQLAMLANRDGLTRLFNRRRFDEHLSTRLAEALRYKFCGALVMLDLDGFKAINDTHGHQAGDAVLVAVADVLVAGTRSSDFVARLGGDEFALELSHIHRDEVIAVATKLLRAVEAPIDWRGQALCIGMSAGIATYPQDGRALEHLVEAADAALYRSKRAGRRRVSVAEISGGDE